MTATGKCSIKSKTSDKVFEFNPNTLSFKETEITIRDEWYVPNVIEPSFGIGRIMYALWEHSFQSRGLEDQESRNFLALSPLIAPVKCSILPISPQPQFTPVVDELRDQLLKHGLSYKVDSSTVSIGKRYARTDEIGVPFGATIDFQTVKDKTVTLRELISMEQVRLPLVEVAPLILSLVRLETDWEKVKAKYPIFMQQEV
eukprot:Protomagalhaensia_wolfi_Nauph_80__3769@NODE_3811_length_704_cov_4_345865_g3008_i0_p1_GENE_NODE_3811_length_704_cov_4_345865_g3008_i0NODE_3811_length_704_cov_4_345865_g3008_i0_p1_ORF_typecomplete_len201_score51_25HGTP_anticodon/PF03129_20/1_2e17tRNAsynt_2b/PF00587_25/0_053_NODE_3811_length_704_cov_4_345865_g3008_i0100702